MKTEEEAREYRRIYYFYYFQKPGKREENKIRQLQSYWKKELMYCLHKLNQYIPDNINEMSLEELKKMTKIKRKELDEYKLNLDAYNSNNSGLSRDGDI